MKKRLGGIHMKLCNAFFITATIVLCVFIFGGCVYENGVIAIEAPSGEQGGDCPVLHTGNESENPDENYENQSNRYVPYGL